MYFSDNYIYPIISLSTVHVGDGRNAPYIDIDSKIDSESDPKSHKLFVCVVNFKVICFDIALHTFTCSELKLG